MAKISLICEQCGGNIILDNAHEIGTCENCYTQFVIKQDQIVQKITQNITKQVYGYEGKDVEELLEDGYRLLKLNDAKKANAKFKKAIDIEPDCWSAWLGYASTNGDRTGYISMVPAYRKAYSLAESEQQRVRTFVDMTGYLPDQYLRSAFVRAFNLASDQERYRIFKLVSGVIGCDESEMAAFAIDLCPNDWRAHFAMAKFRQIRARWCKPEGRLFGKKRLPVPAMEVANIFIKAYQLAKQEGAASQKVILSHVERLTEDPSYSDFANELKKMLENS